VTDSFGGCRREVFLHDAGFEWQAEVQRLLRDDHQILAAVVERIVVAVQDNVIRSGVRDQPVQVDAVAMCGATSLLADWVLSSSTA
jgi:hypothetical protein